LEETFKTNQYIQYRSSNRQGIHTNMFVFE